MQVGVDAEELTVLRWVDWVRAQVAEWPAADDPGEWDGRRVLGEMADDARVAAG